MFFNIDHDDGRSIGGWFAPDNPSSTPKIAIIIPGREEIIVEAGEMRADVRDLGVHNTGKIGFSINESIIPDLEHLIDVEIVDADTRLPIHRRFQPGQHIERKLFMFDCAVMPQRAMLRSIASHFSLSYPSCERNALETMLVVINNHFAKSIFITGRSNHNRYVGMLENAGFLRAALLRDPFEELAERLLFFSLLGKSDASHLLPTYVTGLAPLVEFARDLPFNDPKQLLTVFRTATDEQRQAMMSPMVRMLGCNFDELPDRRHVSLALEHLAAFDVVGTRSKLPNFRALLAQLLGQDTLGDERPANFQTVQSVAQTLSRIGVVVDLLEADIALYALAEEAIDIGLAGIETESGRDTQTM